MAAIAAKSIKKNQQEKDKLKETLAKQQLEANQLQQEGGLVKRRVGSAKRPTITEQVYRQEAVNVLQQKNSKPSIFLYLHTLYTSTNPLLMIFRC